MLQLRSLPGCLRCLLASFFAARLVSARCRAVFGTVAFVLGGQGCPGISRYLRYLPEMTVCLRSRLGMGLLVIFSPTTFVFISSDTLPATWCNAESSKSKMAKMSGRFRSRPGVMAASIFFRFSGCRPGFRPDSRKNGAGGSTLRPLLDLVDL